MPDGTTILDAIKNIVSAKTRVTFSVDGTNAAGADVAIAVIGETPYAEGRGDRLELSIDPADVATIENLNRAGVPVVTVVVSGRPLPIDDVLTKSSALVMAWLPGSEGQGVADVLFGDFRPTGKLSMTFPRSTDTSKDSPSFTYNDGLSY